MVKKFMISKQGQSEKNKDNIKTLVNVYRIRKR